MSAHDVPEKYLSMEELGSKSPVTDSSDPETDTFEDATDAGSIRSLTQRQSLINSRLTPDRLSNANTNVTNSAGEEDKSADKSAGESRVLDAKPRPGKEEGDEQQAIAAEEIQDEHQKSGLDLSHLSAARLDNVDLDDDTSESTAQQDKVEEGPIPNEAPKTMSFSSIANALPAMPWSPTAADPSVQLAAASVESQNPAAAAVTATATATAPPPPSRKLTGPFSWLTRNSSKDQSQSPPRVISPRRNTASSIGTLTSNPEMMLSRLEEERDERDDRSGRKDSLKDRFKQLRMREEVGIVLDEGDKKAGGHALGTVEDKEGSLPGVGEATRSPLPPSSRNLAPGTASGIHGGPSSLSETAVDWDLWQSVVNEGPAAVARSSAEELNTAIATGIPNAIRGVIWQVLAQSKNDELEMVYHELKARGTNREKDRQSDGSISTGSNGRSSIKEPKSSDSSISEHSNMAGNGPPSPKEKDEALQKAQALAVAERQKREKEDHVRLQKLEKMIRKDLGARTSYSRFAAAQGLQDGLFGVCKAYALFDEGVGYSQGMNFLVMPILFNMTEEEAFCLLVRLMNHYHLRDLFIRDMPGLHLRLYQFERLLEDSEPALHCHLHRRAISPHLYATQWFLTLFAYRFPLQLVLRIYDLILSEGLSAILRFGITLMQKNAATLLGMSDMAQLTTYLKDRLFDVYIDASPSSNSILENGFFGNSSSSMDKEVYRADQLVRDACQVKITPELLKMYSAEWEEKTRAEREREAEVENLKTANSGYAIQLRKLEERIEAVDREQADLATELVRTKVQNEELKDENESLKGQVTELRIVIEKQPSEIEQAWQLHRDDLLQRNQSVHEENQRLEKELAELEEELVQTKMSYAEINSQHETLQRKWTDLKRQFA